MTALYNCPKCGCAMEPPTVVVGTTPAADAMYIVLRQLYDPEYGGDPPTAQEAIDAVIAYEKERGMSKDAGNVPRPKESHAG